MRVAIEAARRGGRRRGGRHLLHRRHPRSGERQVHLDYYVELAKELEDAGAHILAIKDMAGLLQARAARDARERLRREIGLPIHFHTHDTAGGQLATYLAAIEAGVDVVDGAVASMAGMTCQPSLAASSPRRHTDPRDTGLAVGRCSSIEPYWEAVRATLRAVRERAAGAAGRVYHHEIPGGQFTNLRQQARRSGWATASRRSSSPTPRSTGCSATSSR